MKKGYTFCRITALRRLFLLALGFICIVTVASCSCSSESEESESVIAEVHQNIVSQKAYNRGFQEGQRIARMVPDSHERTKALLDIQSLITALEKNGYMQTAIDFTHGVKDGLKD